MEIQKRRPGRPPSKDLLGEDQDTSLNISSNSDPAPSLREPIRAEAQSSSEDLLDSLRKESLRSYVERDGNIDDPFYVPENLKDPRFTYEWKATHVMGKELDAAYQANLQQQGWLAAPASLFKIMLPKGSTESFISRGGQVLMMRPKELTDKSRFTEKQKATDQVKSKMAALGMTKPGEMDRKVISVKKSYESMEIPD